MREQEEQPQSDRTQNQFNPVSGEKLSPAEQNYQLLIQPLSTILGNTSLAIESLKAQDLPSVKEFVLEVQVAVNTALELIEKAEKLEE